MLLVHRNGTRIATAYPTSYKNDQLNVRQTASNGVGLGVATRQINAASEDPGTFTIDLARQGLATTLAIKPVPEAPTAETLRSTATRNVTGLTPSSDPSAYQTIDDDPDDGGTDFLAGPDPSGSSGSDSNRYSDAQDGTTPKLKRGGEVLLKDRAGTSYRYRVSEVFITDPKAVWVMGQVRGRDMVTMQTCTRIPTFQKRLIVHTDRV